MLAQPPSVRTIGILPFRYLRALADKRRRRWRKEVRFKNQGLDSIEVQDNGSGIAAHNYESVALKHYTSKLSSYDDLSELQTFGFRGEALSSLCALSRFSVVTCTQQDAPRATRLEFETSGKLKSTSVVSAQRGTTVIVEDLFHNLPVRRRELERNIKREWGKVVNLLNQYACVQTGVKFTVFQQPTKGKRMVLFSTKGNPSTRENIINVFGVKTMNALVPMDLRLELIPTAGPLSKGKERADGTATEVRVLGHVSRPSHGEGRQTPDRQMFYVNGRPCGLPQFAKVFNEVYRSYNASQSPFIFADIQLDTHLYDVNVSPDKRTILLHDQGQMLDNLRESLIELFEKQDVTIPIAPTPALKQNSFRATATARSGTPTSAQTGSSRAAFLGLQQDSDESSPIRRGQPAGGKETVAGDDESNGGDDSDLEAETESRERKKVSLKSTGSLRSVTLLSRWLAKAPDAREESEGTSEDVEHQSESTSYKASPSLLQDTRSSGQREGTTAGEAPSPREDAIGIDGNGETSPATEPSTVLARPEAETETHDLSRRMEAENDETEDPVYTVPLPSQAPSSRPAHTVVTRPLKRSAPGVATITIGDHTVTSVIGEPPKRMRTEESPNLTKSMGVSKGKQRAVPLPSFGGRLSQLFSASAYPNEGLEDKAEGVAEDDDEVMEVSEEQSAEEVEEDDSLFVHQMGKSGHPSEDDVVSDASGEEPLTTTPLEDAETGSHLDSPRAFAPPSPYSQEDRASADGEYIDEEEEKATEDRKVRQMIEDAEATTAEPTEEGEKRSQMFVKGRAKRKDMTLNLVQHISATGDDIEHQIAALTRHLPQPRMQNATAKNTDGLEAADAEEKLSLKISKSDFAKMRVIGQFNLGFILAVRETGSSAKLSSPSSLSSSSPAQSEEDDELFIIDQHASDEKYNFERLQATTTVQSQRLVQPKTLSLTALEEEIILENLPALERNGFVAQVDTSGTRPVGARAQLLSLPLSRETTFGVADLEELLFLLADNPTSGATTAVPRPSKVRKMFAMRACRSSIMIGRALSRRQMERVVRHMGEMEKPWNCPHGRPTMRHLCGLAAWDGRGWLEGSAGGLDEPGGRTDWAAWVREKKGEE